jgi:hypothetical protein
MKERPVLFSGEMVRAILAGRKTQTRRLFRGASDLPGDFFSPHGVPGDRLWVRETFAWSDLPKAPRRTDTGKPFVVYRANGEIVASVGAFHGNGVQRMNWTPSIYMPRWASRIDLEITAVRCERLQDITEEDARAEGVAPFYERFQSIGRDQRITTGELAADAPYRASFAVLWDEINGDRASWASNPWVWAIAFKRIRPAVEVSRG